MNDLQEQALKIVLDYLEQTNAHTVGRLLNWAVNGEDNPARDELTYRAVLAAQNFLMAYIDD